MAAVAHLGVGLAAKRIAPGVPTWILIAAAWAIDVIFGLLSFAGIERMPGPEVQTTNPYSHGLLMAVAWSVLAALVAGRISRDNRTSVVIGLLVISHWVVDFITHPMTAAFPYDPPLSLLFDGSAAVGLGLYGTELGMNVGEYGTLLLGIFIYLLTLLKARNERRLLAISNERRLLAQQ